MWNWGGMTWDECLQHENALEAIEVAVGRVMVLCARWRQRISSLLERLDQNALNAQLAENSVERSASLGKVSYVGRDPARWYTIP